ncbi:MAG TPA: CGNR zinc finger domain-containing protein [Nocardioidaceae bacterium]|nr:CGNR zinc finger domain-containing protein [Nocardioidaceae bacterium]
MDFVGYAERAARLVNASVDDADDVRDFLADRAWLIPRVADRDVNHLRRFQRELRTTFEIASHGNEVGVVEQLNDLLDRHSITPQIAGHGTRSWHLHVSNSSSSVAELLIAEALLGLAILACDLSPLRLGVCQAADCDQVFVDASPNQSRRYCSDRCSSRANVAAYRARRRAAAASTG